METVGGLFGQARRPAGCRLPRCIAYTAGGRICGRPAVALDVQRGGMVCRRHMPRGRGRPGLAGMDLQSMRRAVRGEGV